MTQHASDCAVHNSPAMEPGPCNCGMSDFERQDHLVNFIKAKGDFVEAYESAMRTLTKGSQAHEEPLRGVALQMAIEAFDHPVQDDILAHEVVKIAVIFEAYLRTEAA